MLIGRFGMIVPILALAGSLAAQAAPAAEPGDFPTNGPCSWGCWSARSSSSGALTYFPALSLGPIVEQLQLNAGQTVGGHASR